MGAFELNNKEENIQIQGVEAVSPVDARRIKEECIIALKVYDSCRQLHCK